jgi:hypothetical protein
MRFGSSEGTSRHLFERYVGARIWSPFGPNSCRRAERIACLTTVPHAVAQIPTREIQINTRQIFAACVAVACCTGMHGVASVDAVRLESRFGAPRLGHCTLRKPSILQGRAMSDAVRVSPSADRCVARAFFLRCPLQHHRTCSRTFLSCTGPHNRVCYYYCSSLLNLLQYSPFWCCPLVYCCLSRSKVA